MPWRGFSSDSGIAATAVILAMLCLGVGWWPEVTHGTFQFNDLVLHNGLYRTLRDSLHDGRLGIEDWYDGCCLGAPVFRTYQHLGHLAAAVVGHVFSVSDDSPIRILLLLGIVSQVPAMYVLARSMKFSQMGSVASAWFVPLVSCFHVTGHEFGSYIGIGSGLFSQAIAVPLFLLSLRAAASALDHGAATNTFAQGAEVGGLLGTTFLVHHFYGFMATMTVAAFACVSVVRSPRSARRNAATLAWGALFFLGITAYQLKSIFEDAPMFVASNSWYDPKRIDGFGYEEILRQLFTGNVVDHRRWPVMSGAALLGTLLGVAFRDQRLVYPLVMMAFGVFFSAGRAGNSGVMDFVPGAGMAHAERFLALIHLSTPLLIGTLFSRIETVASSFTHFVRWRRLGVPCLLATLVFVPLQDRFALLKISRDRLAARDRSLRSGSEWLRVLSDARDIGGQFFAMKIVDADVPRLYDVEFFSLAEHFGASQISYTFHSMTFASEAVYLFNDQFPAASRVFDVKMGVVTKGARLKRAAWSGRDILFENDRYAAVRGGGIGPFDVVSIRDQGVIESKEFVGTAAYWLSSEAAEKNVYLGRVPKVIAARYPESLPPISSGGGGGSVVSWQMARGERFEAKLQTSGSGAFGILRRAFHPRWTVIVNGRQRDPRFVVPGFLAFELDSGHNEVQIEFAEDDVRKRLFTIGVMVGVAFLCIVFGAKWRESRAA